MTSSLAICLPVHNAQATIDRMVREALEIAVDLTPRTEVLVIDDGSDDATSEIAYELSLRYPQVRPLRQPLRLGRAVNMRLAVCEATADVVVVRDEDCRLSLGEVDKMWRKLPDFDVVFALADQEPVRGWTKWVQRFKPTLDLEGMHFEDEDARVDLQMIRRRAIETVRWTIGNRTAQTAELERKGYRWGSIQAVRREVGTIPTVPETPSMVPTQTADVPNLREPSPVSKSSVRKPNYLKHLRDFALGE